ncbi:MAG: MBL fold metallo-hydrolase [Vicinamibacterales bacterium]
MRRGRVTFLGTGTSHGVPMIGCTCAVCRSSDPRDCRLRPSVVLQMDEGPTVLIDTGTDLRQQALTYGVVRVDAVLYTHSHADHVMGLDEIRRFNTVRGGPIPAFADERTAAEIRRTFSYVFEPPAQPGGGIPQLDLRIIDGAFDLGPLRVIPVPVWHGPQPILGFRFGEFAYLTDCSAIPDASWLLLRGTDVLVIDALRHRPHPTHFSLSEAVQAAERLRPRQTWFTHIAHDLPHAATNASLPPGMALAHDGLVLDVDVG